MGIAGRLQKSWLALPKPATREENMPLNSNITRCPVITGLCKEPFIDKLMICQLDGQWGFGPTSAILKETYKNDTHHVAIYLSHSAISPYTAWGNSLAYDDDGVVLMVAVRLESTRPSFETALWFAMPCTYNPTRRKRKLPWWWWSAIHPRRRS